MTEKKCQECGGGGAMPMRTVPQDEGSPVVDACVACWRAGRGVPFGEPDRRRWNQHLRGILEKIDLSNFPVGVRFEGHACRRGCCAAAVISILVRDRDMPEVWTTISSEARVPPDITEDALLEKLLDGIKNGLEHELRESFLVSERRPFDPHAPKLMP